MLGMRLLIEFPAALITWKQLLLILFWSVLWHLEISVSFSSYGDVVEGFVVILKFVILCDFWGCWQFVLICRRQ